MTEEEKVKSRETEAQVASLAKLLWAHNPRIASAREAFAFAVEFYELRQERWEALK